MWLSKGKILGAMAMWAIRQSPYDVPDDLEAVLKKAGEAMASDFTEENMGMKEFSHEDWRELDSYIRDKFWSITEFMLWNERKNGNKSSYGFCSRYDTPNPDNDFIDLDALTRNVCNTILKEAADDREWDEKYDRERKAEKAELELKQEHGSE